MNGFPFLFDASVWQPQATRLALTLLHLVWQCLVVGAFAGIVLRLLQVRSARSRYLAASGTFFSLPVLAASTFFMLPVPNELPQERLGGLIESDSPAVNFAGFEQEPISRPADQPIAVSESTVQVSNPETQLAGDEVTFVNPSVTQIGLAEHLFDLVYQFLPLSSVIYILGVVAMLLRLSLTIWRGSRICAESSEVNDPILCALVARLAEEAGLRCVPTLRYCNQVIVPAVAGIFQPVILIPMSLLSHLTTEQLTSILDHELAHIRRFDPLVQAMQKVVEAILFFHPVTWWLSRKMDDERENCCDDWATNKESGRFTYAAALLKVAELCVASKPQLAPRMNQLSSQGANTHQLSRRIERILGAESPPRLALGRFISLVLVAVLSVSLASVAVALVVDDDPKPSPNGTSGLNHTAVPESVVMTAQVAGSEDELQGAAGREKTRSDQVVKTIWSKKTRDGLTAGARLLSATGKLDLGDPVVVQFVLLNGSDKDQTIILRASDSHPVLGANNRLELNIIGNSQSTYQHTLKPGEVLEERRYRISIDTAGMLDGNYQITSGSAFWRAKEGNLNSASGIPFGQVIAFTLGDPEAVKLRQPAVDQNVETKIYWGKPSGNLVLGIRLPKGREVWPNDNVDIEGQLFLFNAGDSEIEVVCELPNVLADWNMNVTSRDHNKFVRLDSTWYTGLSPMKTRTIRLQPGQRVAVTGVEAEVLTGGQGVAVQMIGGPTLRVLKQSTEFKYGDPKRLIAQQGRFYLNAALTIRPSGLLDSVVVASAGAVPFTISSDAPKLKLGGVPSDGDSNDGDPPKAKPSKDESSQSTSDGAEKHGAEKHGAVEHNAAVKTARADAAGDPISSSKVETSAGSTQTASGDQTLPLDRAVWWDIGDGLEAGFLLTSPAFPNHRLPMNSVAKYQILVRNQSDKDIQFLARLLPHQKRDSPFLIPSDNITAAMKADTLPNRFRATDGPAHSLEPAYVIKLTPGEAAVIRSQQARDELAVFVGNLTPKISVAQAAVEKRGMNWIVQPLQIHRVMPPAGTRLMGSAYQLTKVGKDGRTRTDLAVRRKAEPGGEVFYPRIQLEVGTRNANALANAKLASWGKIDQGLQCGIRLQNAQSTYKVGDVLEAELLWRNVSDADIWTPIPRQFDLFPMIHDSEFNHLTIQLGARMRLPSVNLKFESKEVRSLGVFRIELLAEGMARPSGRLQQTAFVSLDPGKYFLSGAGGVSGLNLGAPVSDRVKITVAQDDS
ncbi:MAG: M56 family metallopeptidase [Fuerstiella sp.]